MVPVDQTRFYDPTRMTPPGNCFHACVATIIGCALEDVPDEKDGWSPRMNANLSWRKFWKRFLPWLADRGMAYFETADLFPNAEDMVGVPCIISGPSPRDDSILHATVGSFETSIHGAIATIRHDPHPSRAGLKPGNWTYGYFVKRSF